MINKSIMKTFKDLKTGDKLYVIREKYDVYGVDIEEHIVEKAQIVKAVESGYIMFLVEIDKRRGDEAIEMTKECINSPVYDSIPMYFADEIAMKIAYIKEAERGIIGCDYAISKGGFGPIGIESYMKSREEMIKNIEKFKKDLKLVDNLKEYKCVRGFDSVINKL